MPEWLKTWKKESDVPEALGTTAIVTVIMSVFFFVILVFAKTITLLFDWLGLWWVLQTWIGVCLAYVLGLMWFEYRDYRRNPIGYNFWGNDDDDDDNENETGVS